MFHDDQLHNDVFVVQLFYYY